MAPREGEHWFDTDGQDLDGVVSLGDPDALINDFDQWRKSLEGTCHTTQRLSSGILNG